MVRPGARESRAFTIVAGPDHSRATRDDLHEFLFASGGEPMTRRDRVTVARTASDERERNDDE